MLEVKIVSGYVCNAINYNKVYKKVTNNRVFTTYKVVDALFLYRKERRNNADKIYGIFI